MQRRLKRPAMAPWLNLSDRDGKTEPLILLCTDTTGVGLGGLIHPLGF
jgi:hypothetical protein